MEKRNGSGPGPMEIKRRLKFMACQPVIRFRRCWCRSSYPTDFFLEEEKRAKHGRVERKRGRKVRGDKSLRDVD